MPEEKSPITLANERYTIIDACNEVGMEVFGGTGRMKFYCPFGEMWHADAGRSKAFAIYEHTNSAYCWACGTYFTPVKLIAADKDMTDLEAATWILENTNYVAPDYQAVYDAAAAHTPEVDRDALTEALRLSCARFPAWEERQFDPRVSQFYTRLLTLLPKVKDEDSAREWLTTAKTVMKRELERA